MNINELSEFKMGLIGCPTSSSPAWNLGNNIALEPAGQVMVRLAEAEYKTEPDGPFVRGVFLERLSQPISTRDTSDRWGERLEIMSRGGR